ncbi:MAG: hypothetical protein J6A25_06620 [Lachnospiraceae bacterium]|nr:hypothetical protein [Lachnospiraceae bacterium]
MVNVQEQIFRSIETIVDKKIEGLAFDKTIEGIIVDASNGESGEYKVRYQDIIFDAYSSINTVKYEQDDNVIVLVPEGNFSLKKSIIGTKENKGEQFLDVVDIMDKIQRIGYNYVDEPEDYAINLEGGKDKEVHFRLRKGDMIADYPGKTNIMIGARIESELKKEVGGDFGIEMQIKYVDTILTYRLSLANLTGNPYKLINKYQSIIFPLPAKQMTEVIGIKGYIKGFKESGHVKFSYIDVQYIKPRDAEGLENLSGEIYCPDGNIFKNGIIDDTQKLTLTMDLYKLGELYTPPATYKWFYADPRVTDEFDSQGRPMKGYDSDGGEGWYYINTSDQDYDANIIEIIDGGKSISITPKAVPNIQTFKCVATVGGQLIGGVSLGFSKVHATQSVVDQTDAINVVIESSEGDVFKEYGNITHTTLECKVILGAEQIDPTKFNYVWSKLTDNGTEEQIAANTQNPQYLTVEVRNDIIDTRTYFCRVYTKN